MFSIVVLFQVESEVAVFEALMSWVKHSPNTRKEHLALLMSFVRLPLLSAKYITDVVDEEVSPHSILRWKNFVFQIIH